MRWKRWSTVCLAAVMTLSLVLTACSGSGGNASGTNDGGQASESIVTPKGTYPIVEEKVTLKVMVPSEALVENFETNEFTKWYEEKTNVHVEWIVVPQQSASEKLNLMLASGDYPDVIMRFGVTPAQQMIYGNQGVFLPLNDLIEQYGDNFKKCSTAIRGCPPRLRHLTAIFMRCRASTTATIARWRRRCGSTSRGSTSWAWTYRPRRMSCTPY